MRRWITLVILLALLASVSPGLVRTVALSGNAPGDDVWGDSFMSHPYHILPGEILPIDYMPSTRQCFESTCSLTVFWMVMGHDEVHSVTPMYFSSSGLGAEIVAPLYESTLKIWGTGSIECYGQRMDLVVRPIYVEVVDPHPQTGWYQQITRGDWHLSSIEMARDGVGWALPSYSFCGRVETTDAGVSWARVGGCPGEQWVPREQDRGLALGSDGTVWKYYVLQQPGCGYSEYDSYIYKAGDSSYQERWIPGAVWAGQVDIVDGTTGFALSDEVSWDCDSGASIEKSGIYRMNDGATWERIADAPCYNCGILALDSQNVWLLESRRFWHSEDSGETWHANVPPEMSGLRGIWFSDPLHSWVVGQSGVIFHSQDGGLTWAPQQSGTDAHLNAVRFVGTEFGWAVGNQGTILATTDGGANWHKQGSPLDVNLNALYFRDRWTGWIAGDEGVIIHTRTGGEAGPADALPSLKSTGQITVDGSLDEWKDYPQIDLNVETADWVHGVLSSAAGDSSATVYSAWDDDYLYLAARIYDDVLVHDSANLSDDDAVEFGLDGLHDHQGEQTDDHSYTIRVDGVVANSGTPVTDGNEISATRILTDGWSLELAVPWARLGGQLATYRTIGFTLGLHDDDDGGDADAYMIWKGWNTYDGGWGYWGHVWLVGGSPSVRPRVFLPLISSTLSPP